MSKYLVMRKAMKENESYVSAQWNVRKCMKVSYENGENINEMK
jgi:hypothetical protein